MGYIATKANLDAFIKELAKDYQIFAPKRYSNGGTFSDTDCIRYGEISSIEEVIFEEKSNYSFKETVLPIIQTLFHFTKEGVREETLSSKGIVVFLRSCDLHGVKRLDDMYLSNGQADYYYAKSREKVKFILMGCKESFENCFCVSMGTNQSTNYDLSIDFVEGEYRIDCKNKDWETSFDKMNMPMQDIVPFVVTENKVVVSIPENIDVRIAKSTVWDEYDARCIACGRCNFVCPTCSCFTMQDMFYDENVNVGERRRVWASCMVDGFTEVAGGGNYRKKHGERMRFKVLHKIHDFKQRNGYHMCVGCGRCDDICPEYISFSNCVNKLEHVVKEVMKDEA